MAAPGDAANTRVGAVILRGAFLACSWTWCIGMFLPVLLINDFGLGGWLVFAIPNVLGAAMMGVALRGRRAADRLVIDHPGWTSLFSWVVLGFHAFFCVWLASNWLVIQPGVGFDPPPGLRGLTLTMLVVILTRPALVSLLLVSMVFAGALVVSRLSFKAACGLAIVLWALSIGLVLTAASPLAGEEALSFPAMTGSSPTMDLMWVVPICVFGFALCPYLDLTFLRVRRETPGDVGSAAFIFGFCVLFLAMITLTMLYATELARTWLLPATVAAHMIVQMIFTLGVHMRELAAMRGEPRATRLPLGLAFVGACVILPLMAYGTGANLLIYKSFLWFYGLLFPAVMWICVLHAARGGASRRSQIIMLVLCVALATPFFWFGFIEQMWWLLAPGVLIPLVAPLTFSARRRSASAALSTAS